MKLWILRPQEHLIDANSSDSPWYPWYDCAFGFVIRAETEAEARALANKEGGDEVEVGGLFKRKHANTWINPGLTTCTELTAGGETELVMMDFHAA